MEKSIPMISFSCLKHNKLYYSSYFEYPLFLLFKRSYRIFRYILTRTAVSSSSKAAFFLLVCSGNLQLVFNLYIHTLTPIETNHRDGLVGHKNGEKATRAIWYGL